MPTRVMCSARHGNFSVQPEGCLRNNALQFAVVREDPTIDLSIVSKCGAKQLLLIASGGCTALHLASCDSSLAITVLDPNPAQLAHVRRKVSALKQPLSERLRLFNINHDNPDGLSECGNFESLFRGLRSFIYDFILGKEQVEQVLRGQAPVDLLTEHTYWPVGFELFFAQKLLNTMFGPAATQYAPPGSYPAYFQAAFERGLQRDDRIQNGFLHHLLLGHYLKGSGSVPVFVQSPPLSTAFQYIEGQIDDAVDLSVYDFIGLSNICDWMSPDAVERLFQQINRQVTRGAVVVWRQLNNDRDLENLLDSRFHKLSALEKECLKKDRSLFYNHIGVMEAR